MNIQNIQNAQGLFRAVDERSGSRKERINGLSDTSIPQIHVPDAQDKAVDIPRVSGEKDLLQVVYPPFFPMGSTQDILSIEGVRLAGEAAKSTAMVAVDEQRSSQQKEINSKAKSDALLTNKTPDIEQEVKHKATLVRAVLDLKV